MNSIPRSCTTASQNQAMSATERARSSSKVSMPFARISRVTFAPSMSSRVGVHTTSTASRYNRVRGTAGRHRRRRLVGVHPDDGERLLQGTDVRGGPGRLPGSRREPEDRRRFVRLRLRGLRGGHQHLRRVPARSARRRATAGPDGVIRRIVRPGHRRDADPQRDRLGGRGRGALEGLERRLARQGGPLRLGSGAEPSARRSRARRRRLGDAALPPGVGSDGRRLRRGGRSATGLTRPRTVAHPTPRRRRAPTIRCGSPSPWARPPTASTAASCIVLAAEDRAGTDPVFVQGVGWNQDAPSLESRDWDRAAATARAAEQAYARAGVTAGGHRRRRGRRHLRVQAAPAPRRARPRRPRSRPRQPLGRRAGRGVPARGQRPRARPRLHRAAARRRGHHRGGPVLARGAQQQRRRRGPDPRRCLSDGRRVAVIGAGMTKFVRRAQETGKELSWIAGRAALDNAGISLADVDAVCAGTAPDAFDGVHRKGDYLADGSGALGQAVHPHLRGRRHRRVRADPGLVHDRLRHGRRRARAGRGEDVELPAAPPGRVPHDLRQRDRTPARARTCCGSSRWRCSATCRPTAWTSATSRPSP